MPNRIVTTTIISLLVIPIYFQITRANAEHDPLTHPLTPPITSEITPTDTPTNTPTMTPTNTPTMTPTNTPTMTPTMTPTNTPTPTITVTPTNTPTPTPEEDGTIEGKVILRNLNPFPRGAAKTSPAAGVEVTVEEFFGGDEVGSDTTDSNGMYAIDVPPGLYKVTVDDNTNTQFVPPLKVVNVQEDQEKQANFQGLTF